MNYKIKVIPKFEKELKRLSKKYPSLKAEFINLVSELEKNPKQGTSLGNHCYKIRLSIASKGKGRSGGARVITYVQVVNSTIYLLSIYDKSEQQDISNKDLSELLKYIV